MSVGAQAMLHQENIMQRGNDGEGECGAQEYGAGDPDPADGAKRQEHDEEDGSDLREGVGLPEDAGAEIAKPCDGKENGAGGKNRNVAAKYKDSESPGDLTQDREDEEHGAEQKLVGYRVKVLPKKCLLMELAGE